MLALLLTTAAYPCDWLIYDDYADGSADGHVYGGTFVPGGWRPDGGTIVYDLPDVTSGTITMRLSNVEEAGVAQHDLLELFSGDDGSFSDSRRDNFLQVKFAGDIYDGYDGRVKLQAGPEWYGDIEVGAWTSEFDWQPDQAYDFTIQWGGTGAGLGIANVLSTGIDYGYYGPLSFRTLRIPNDTTYARDAQLDDIVIAGVSLCGTSGTPTSPDDADTDTDADTDSDTDADTDTDTDADSDADTEPPTDSELPPAPSFRDVAIGPPTVLAGEPWQVAFAVTGPVDAARFCFAGASSAFDSCTDVDLSGHAEIGTDGLSAGAYAAWLVATGPGGEATSTPVALAIDETVPVAARSCGTALPSPSLATLLAGALLGLARRRGPGLRSPRA